MNHVNNPLFPNQDFGRVIYKHNKLPVYMTDEFDFFRCVPFNESFYGKTVYELNNGNLRFSNLNNRYSSLFPNQKLSYWADSIKIARKEIKKHNKTNNLLTFWSYDDATSIFPIIDNSEPLIIIDGRDIKFHEILYKSEKGIELNDDDKRIIEEIVSLNPDCLAYKSIANPRGINYLFFEKGFKKLSIREVKLRLGDLLGKNKNNITCSVTSDYNSYPKEYGKVFLPIAKIGFDENYLSTEDYKEKLRVNENSRNRYKTSRRKTKY